MIQHTGAASQFSSKYLNFHANNLNFCTLRYKIFGAKIQLIIFDKKLNFAPVCSETKTIAVCQFSKVRGKTWCHLVNFGLVWHTNHIITDQHNEATKTLKIAIIFSLKKSGKRCKSETKDFLCLRQKNATPRNGYEGLTKLLWYKTW